MTNIVFKGVTHTEDSVRGMGEADLLALRNDVADSLGVAKIKSFKDHEQARSATWKALEKFATEQGKSATATGGGGGAATGGKAAAQKKDAEPKEPRVVKGAAAMKVKRPTRSMFRKIEKVKEPDRVKERWGNYKDGMTVLETIEGEGMTPLDIYFYAEQDFVKLHDPTEEEYQAGMAAWYKREGIENPAEAKAAKDAERAKKTEEVKAKRDADAKTRTEAKAAKDAERAAERAKADADKKAKADAAAAKTATT